MRRMTRRSWLKHSLAALGGAAALAAPRRAWSKALGANGDVRLAVIGVQRRGRQLIELFRKVPGVRVVGLCDADRRIVEAAARPFAKRNEKPRVCVDFRRLLDDKDVDAVAIATPNHWHALMCVWACQAGKDVYVEKPVSHNIREGRKMVEAARKHGRIVQAGTQNRSDVGLQAAIRHLGEGHLGKIVRAWGFDFPRRTPIGKVPGPQPIPEGVDYNLFMGPAPLVPLRRRRLHYDWHFVWATGSGDCGNRGIHTLDHIRWLIGQTALAGRVRTLGGRFAFDDDGETPNTQITILYGQPVPIIYQLLTLPRREGVPAGDRLRRLRRSMVIECEGGFFAGGRGGGSVHDRRGKVIRSFKGDSGQTHYANFIDAVRSRNRADLRAEILEGHLSSALCHMASISYLVGQHCPRPEEARRTAGDDEVFGEVVEALLRHLSAHKIDLGGTPLTVGPLLTMDVPNERFVGDGSDWANMYLTRNYRRPFVMPDDV